MSATKLLKTSIACISLLVTAAANAYSLCYMLVSTGYPGSNPDLPRFLADISVSPTRDVIPSLQKKMMQVSKHERDGVRSALGYVYCSTGQFELAIQSLEKLINKKGGFNPHRLSALTNTAISHYELGNHDAAAEFVERIKKSNEFGRVIAVGAGGEIALNLGRLELAQDLLEEHISAIEAKQRKPQLRVLKALADVYRTSEQLQSLERLEESYGDILESNVDGNPAEHLNEEDS